MILVSHDECANLHEKTLVKEDIEEEEYYIHNECANLKPLVKEVIEEEAEEEEEEYSIHNECANLYAMRYGHEKQLVKEVIEEEKEYAEENIKVEEQKPVHVDIETKKEPCDKECNEKCPLCGNVCEYGMCSTKYMYCTRKKRYTDEYIENKRVNNQIYDLYYDAYIPVSNEKNRLNYISVESIRKGIREYKLADKSGGDNTYKQLDAFARSVMFFI